MANATANRKIIRIGPAARRTLQKGVDGGTRLYIGTLVAQLPTGMLVPGTTATAGPAIGINLLEVDATLVGDNVKESRIETDGDVILDNGLTTDACGPDTILGANVWMIDDHTVADNDGGATRQIAGTFQGMDPRGVRVRLSAPVST